MNKDVIYIDVDDDITAIIGKIKASKEKIVALVPPKRIGVLQSAVNLRLLDRMAKTSKKHLVIITNNQALVALTASARIPTARNLQSKPEVAEIPALAVDDGDDIIDGSELPISDHLKSAGQDDEPKKADKGTRDDAINALSIDGESVETEAEDGPTETQLASKAIKSSGKKNKVKIPNFNSFRKRLVLVIIAVVLLVGLGVWMFIFAPAATITLTARTSPSPISTQVTLDESAATSYEDGRIKSLVEELEKNETVQFDATGEKEVGEAATGQIVFENCESDDTITVPAGTTVTANGNNYTTLAAAAVPGGEGFACSTPGTSEPVGVRAADVGEAYNTESGTVFSVAGRNQSSGVFYFRGVADGAVDGGSSETVTIVSSEDIERAKGQLIGQSTEEARAELETQFGESTIVIPSSFTVTRGKTTSSPAVNAEVADGKKATLTVATTYTMYGVSKVELEVYLKANLADRIENEDSQEVYDTGVDSVGIGGFKKSDDAVTATLTATGQVGPKIDEAAVKEMVKGKITGDVQSALQQIDGIQDVRVRYSYFWVRTVPNDENKIRLEFQLEENDS